MKKHRFRFILNLFLIIIIALAIEIYIDNNVIEVSNYEIVSKKIPDSFDETVILHISDLHSKVFGKDNVRLINAIDKINPDYIMITGDMVNATDTDFSVFFNVIDKIKDKYTIYYIVGNHESALKSNYYTEIMDKLKKAGVKVLDNEKVTISQGGDTINLYGMWYPIKYYFNDILEKSDIESRIGKSSDKYNILLTHNPKDFEVYVDWGADLVLTGHVHGGMVRLPFVGPLISPDRTFFPKYSQGEYKIEGKSMIVSRGLGRGLTGFRLFNRPELGVIVLKTQK